MKKAQIIKRKNPKTLFNLLKTNTSLAQEINSLANNNKTSSNTKANSNKNLGLNGTSTKNDNQANL